MVGRRALVAFGLIGAAGIACGLVRDGRGQPPPRAEAKAKAGPTRTYLSAAACAQCHTEAHRLDLPAAEAFAPGVQLNEARTWNDQDRHRHAFDALSGERGRQIGEILDLDVKKAKECLSCHSTGFLPADAALASDAEAGKGEGVGCIACHGPYREWAQAHGLIGAPSREWRALKAQEKLERYGMADLHNPERRAAACYSCHIGNAGEKKVVTHAMYAAGHPPLPSVEPATFARAMPRHWREPAGRQAQLAVIGAAVALRESMALLAAEQSRPDAAKRPEYASYDCRACHHDLKTPDPLMGPDADDRHSERVPGRPQVRPWPFVLAELGLKYVECQTVDRTLRAEYNDARKALRLACDARPFGDSGTVAKAARGLHEWSDKLVKELNQAPFNAESVPTLLCVLAELAASEPPDYDTARQLAWAYQSIAADGAPGPADALFRDLLKLGENDPRQALSRAAEFDPKAFQKAFATLAR